MCKMSAFDSQKRKTKYETAQNDWNWRNEFDFNQCENGDFDFSGNHQNHVSSKTCDFLEQKSLKKFHTQKFLEFRKPLDFQQIRKLQILINDIQHEITFEKNKFDWFLF